MPPVQSDRKSPLGRPATAAERVVILPANDRILDDACTLLAALRIGTSSGAESGHNTSSVGKIEHHLPSEAGRADFYTLQSNPLLPYPLEAPVLQLLLGLAGFLDQRGAPMPEPTRQFLEASRSQALLTLVQTWLRTADFNELHLIQSLSMDGAWRNDPLRARHAVLDFISTVPGGFGIGDPQDRPFWSISSLVTAVRQSEPDFQRTAGEYETWFIKRRADGEVLRGFENWEAVEGELIRFIITGPLHWLGIVDLGLPEASGDDRPMATAFRFSSWAADLLSLKTPADMAPENQAIYATRDGRLLISARAPRAARYQAARFAEWEKLAQDNYHYRLTPLSLAKARRQGLRIQHLIALLHQHAQAVPPGLIHALEHWEAEGSSARLERVLVLRFKDPELLVTLRNTPLKRYFGELLGPATVTVRPGGVEKLVDGLAEMGYLTDVDLGDL